MTLDKEALAPCPFCGGKPELDQISDYASGADMGQPGCSGGYITRERVLCRKCGAAHEVPHNFGGVHWNTRLTAAGHIPEKGWVLVRPDSIKCLVTKNPFGSDTWPEGLECPCANCQAMLAAIAAVKSCAAVPEGWKLVPIKPTQAMIETGQQFVTRHTIDVVGRWKAMLAAAPSPPSQE